MINDFDASEDYKEKYNMNMKPKENRWIIIIPTLLALLNLIIKCIFISNNSIGGDEPFSIYHAQMDVSSIIKLLSTGNNPPLYEILLHFWIKFFGISELAVRFPSLIFSTITVFYIFKLGLKHLNLKIAIYSSLIFIFSNYQILFAHEARVYAFLGMLTIMSMYYFLELIFSKNPYSFESNNKLIKVSNKRNYTLYILSNILLIYSHYFGFFVLIVQFLFILFNKKLLFAYWKQLVLTIGILVILYSPNIIVIVNRFHDSSANGTWVSSPNGINSIYNMLRILSNAPIVAVSIIIIFLTAIIKYIIQYKTHKVKLSNKLIIFWFVFIFFFMFGISYLIPMFLDRYLMPASIAFCILLGISVDYLVKKKSFEYILPGILCVLFIVTVKPNITNKRNVKETVEAITNLKNDKTIVYFCPSWFEMNFTYYYNISCFKNYNTNDIKVNMYKCLNGDNIFPIDGENQININQLKKFEKVIFLDAGADFSFPNNGILKRLNDNFVLENKYEFYEIFKVYEFKLK